MTRPWNLEGLMAAHVLAAADAPLAHIALALDRQRSDVDLALWALVGRTPVEAMLRLNGTGQAAPAIHPLRRRITAILALGCATYPEIAEILGEDPREVDAALTEAAWAGVVDGDDPPMPAPRSAMLWRLCLPAGGGQARLQGGR